MNRFTVLASTTALVLGAGHAAHAGGLGIPGYGSQAQPRAGAFAAKADDPSAIFHNPAGLAKLSGTVLQLGINFVNFSQTFQREGTYDQCTDSKCPEGGLPFAGQPYEKIENQAHGGVSVADFAVVPLISAASDFGLDLPIVFAAGIFAPMSGSPDREYAPGYQLEADPNTPPPPGRYDVIRQEVLVLLPSLAAAYRVNDKLDVGARVSWGFGHIKGETSTWGLRNYEEWEGFDAVIAIDAKDNFIPAFGVGALYRPLDSVELGFNYRSGASIRAKGIAVATSGSGTLIEGLDVLEPRTEAPFVCGPGGTLAGFTACVELALPQVAAIASRWILRDGNGEERADIELDVQWEDWSAASDIVNQVDAKTVTLQALPDSVIRHGFKDVFSVRLGGSYTVPVKEHKINVRGGVAYDTEAAPESWTRLDQDGMARTTIGTGLAYELPGWRFEVSGGAVLEGTRTVSHDGCNPDPSNVGCANDREVPVADRVAPDPAQPIYSESNQAQSPFNAGVYEQGYVFMGMGVTAWW